MAIKVEEIPVRSYPPDVQSTGEEYRQYVLTLGADVYGVAAAEDFSLFPTKPQPERFVQGAKSVIVIGLAYSRGTTASKQGPRFRTAPFYHTVAMYLAGMGTMGLNCCILTPEFGPRVFVTSAITNRELPAGRPLAEDICDKERCLRCVKACLSGALDGKGWKNPFACASYGCCGTCVAICPKGQG